MDKKNLEVIKMLRSLVSDVQGAPFPDDDLKPELYKIWYEHAQVAAIQCFEYLNANFPKEQQQLEKSYTDKLVNKFFHTDHTFKFVAANI